MARRLGSLFFTVAKKMARLQRQALKPAVRATTAKKAAGKAAARSRPEFAVLGTGTWSNMVHKTAPTHSELLGRLTYSLYRPPGSVAGMPLVVMLHGCQQTALDMARGSRMNMLADKHGFVVAYPQQVKRLQALRCWRWFQPDAHHGLAEAAAIAELALALTA